MATKKDRQGITFGGSFAAPRRLPQSGYYILLMYLRRSAEIRIGRRPPEPFPRGWYAYTGSAKKSFGKRLERHTSHEKKLYWHIDYLIAAAELRRIYIIPDEDQSLRSDASSPAAGGAMPFECSLTAQARGLEGGSLLHSRFGSGDCVCPGHLVFFRRNPGDSITRELSRFDFFIARRKNG